MIKEIHFLTHSKAQDFLNDPAIKQIKVPAEQWLLKRLYANLFCQKKNERERIERENKPPFIINTPEEFETYKYFLEKRCWVWIFKK